MSCEPNGWYHTKQDSETKPQVKVQEIENREAMFAGKIVIPLPLLYHRMNPGVDPDVERDAEPAESDEYKRTDKPREQEFW